ncbi:MAG: hypothetical protein JWR90_2198 [Marmoricola sp.]|jgi:hypothetical protein|nr:hypothetical protein [Marmoricola sp.]
MISLTYLSTATVPYSPEQLSELLASSRERNHAAGLTGMLLYAGEHFIQTLEGAEDVVDATYARIERDTRHRNVYVALREEITTRVFPDWSMGFESLSDDEAAGLPGFNDYLERSTMSPEAGRELGRAGIFHRVFRDNMR